jgi:hypothetical protein
MKPKLTHSRPRRPNRRPGSLPVHAPLPEAAFDPSRAAQFGRAREALEQRQSAITAAARSLARYNLTPEDSAGVCPDPLAASALKYEMEQLAFTETVSCALLEAPTPAQAWLRRLAR